MLAVPVISDAKWSNHRLLEQKEEDEANQMLKEARLKQQRATAAALSVSRHPTQWAEAQAAKDAVARRFRRTQLLARHGLGPWRCYVESMRY